MPMSRERSFHDLYAHGMVRVAAAVPRVQLAVAILLHYCIVQQRFMTVTP